MGIQTTQDAIRRAMEKNPMIGNDSKEEFIFDPVKSIVIKNPKFKENREKQIVIEPVIQANPSIVKKIKREKEYLIRKDVAE